MNLVSGITKKSKRKKKHWEKDGANGLSYTKMINVLNRKHPRIHVDGTGVHIPILASTGFHAPMKSVRKTKIDFMGTGMTLYFKFIKFMIVCLLIATVLSIPAMVFYAGDSKKSDNENTTIFTVVARTTLGNLGSTRPTCVKVETLTSSEKSKATLFCEFGTLRQIEMFGL